jgi:hypothetical protein
MVFVTVYVPDKLAERSICPVAVLTKTRPGVEENTPVSPPGSETGAGSAWFWQYGDPVYANEATMMPMSTVRAGLVPHALVAVTLSVPPVATALKSMVTLFPEPLMVCPVPLYDQL